MVGPKEHLTGWSRGNHNSSIGILGNGSIQNFNIDKIFGNETKRLMRTVYTSLLVFSRTLNEERRANPCGEKELLKLFYEIDNNQDGVLDNQEIEFFTSNQKLLLTKKELDILVGIMDIDHDGRITSDDFIDLFLSY